MDSYKIITNTTADLPAEYIRENDLGLIYFNYIMDGISYGKDKELDWKEFYRLMREEGKMPTTSQVNPQQYREYFTEFLKENKKPALSVLFLRAERLLPECGSCRRGINGRERGVSDYRCGFQMCLHGGRALCPQGPSNAERGKEHE